MIGALQNATLTSADFSSIATDANGVIQTFNVGAERMLGFKSADVVNKITPADTSDSNEIVARANALSVDISVTDEGIGIGPEDLDRLFRPFSQIDAGLARKFEGAGLGLAMVKLLAELHGAVGVESGVGRVAACT